MIDFLPKYKHCNLLNFNDFVNRTFWLKNPLFFENFSKKIMQLKWF